MKIETIITYSLEDYNNDYTQGLLLGYWASQVIFLESQLLHIVLKPSDFKDNCKIILNINLIAKNIVNDLTTMIPCNKTSKFVKESLLMKYKALESKTKFKN